MNKDYYTFRQYGTAIIYFPVAYGWDAVKVKEFVDTLTGMDDGSTDSAG